MKQIFSCLLKICLGTAGYLCATSKISLAQVTADDTVNTQVERDAGVAEITGGETRGSNLFHSFEDFSVPTNNEAFFNNADSIGNIFSRVTGGDASNIDGAIRANGGANLFLINPAGIIFGENASLNIGGSFYGSTADSIIFPEGEFSAIAPESESVLTVDVPIGLGFGSNPGNITNNSVANDGNGLEVAAGKNITLLGGDLNFDRGAVTASGGKINLGGLATAGKVDINDDGSFSFPEETIRGNVRLTNTSSVSNLSEQGGSIFINSQNLSLTSGSIINSAPGNRMDLTGIRSGDIAIDVLDSVTIDGTDAEANFPSGIFGVTDAESNSEGLNLVTSNLSITNGGQIGISTFGRGSAGNISIEASESISIDGQSSAGVSSEIFSSVEPDADGNVGQIKMTTDSLSLTNGAQIDASTSGRGNAGSIDIVAQDISVDGQSSADLATGVFSSIEPDADGNVGQIKMTTGSLSLTNGGKVDASTLGRVNAGNISIDASESVTIDGTTADGIGASGIGGSVEPGAEGDTGETSITTSKLSLTNGGQIGAGTFGQGNGGNILIDASESVTIDGRAADGNFVSGIGNTVQPGAEGDTGEVSITTSELSLTNGGQIGAATFGQGDGGDISIDASESVAIDGTTTDVNGLTGIGNSVQPGAEGDTGEISITTSKLSLTNGGQIGAATFGQGDGGDISIDASELITIDGIAADGNGVSTIGNTVQPGAEGNSGEISITTSKLSLTNGGQIGAATSGQGNGGNISIDASESVTIDGTTADSNFLSGIANSVEAGAVGDSGEISITTSELSLTNGGQISAATSGQGDGGNISIDASESVTIDGATTDGNFSSGIANSVQPEAEGDTGEVNITTSELRLTDSGQISAATFGQGNGGNISIDASESVTIDGTTADGNFSSGIGNTVQPEAEGDTGEVNITTSELRLTDGGQISAATFGQGDGGNISIDASESVTIDGTTADGNGVTGIGNTVQPGAQGDTGEVNITTSELSLTNGGQIDAGTFGQGDGGNISIDASESVAIDGTTTDVNGLTGIGNTVQPGAQGDSGEISITTSKLSLTNGGQIAAATFGQGDGGNISIDASESVTIDGTTTDGNFSSVIGNSVEPGAEGDSGEVNITTSELSLANGGQIIASAFGQGDGGNISIDANSLSLNDAAITASTVSGQGGFVDLQIAEDITLENNSSISAQAFENADGGNLSIDAKFIVATPNQNNDLVASAEQGTGGNINIVSAGVFGLKERSSTSDNNTNDIDASSELGVDGTVYLNTNDDFLNSFELIIPEFVVAEKALQGSCFARRNSQQGSFVYGGTGGLPVSPDSAIDEEVNFSYRLLKGKPNRNSSSSSDIDSAETTIETAAAVPKWQIGDPIVEPTNLVKTADGRMLWVNKQASRDSLVCQ